MNSFRSDYLRLEEQPQGVKKIILTRPDVKNAFNSQMIADMSKIFKSFSKIKDHTQLRLVVLAGENDIFCAGADLAYMKAQSTKNFNQNLADAKKLGAMFLSLAKIPCPVISAVRGFAIAGGLGLCACSDYVFSEDNAMFSTSEVRLGLIPALIGPYIIRKICVTHAAHLMLTGEKISAHEAMRIGLVNKTSVAKDFNQNLETLIQSFLMAEPKSSWLTKKLIHKISPLPNKALIEHTARQIAQARSSSEGKEGVRCFLEKKRPSWC